MKKLIGSMLAVAFLCGGLSTATAREELPEELKAPYSPKVLKMAERAEREAEDGDPKSQYLLGGMFERGILGKIENYQKAFEWTMKSAKQGYLMSYNVVAMFYADGIGVEKNLVEARAWCLVAKSEGDELSGRMVYEFNLSREDVVKSQARAEEIQREIKENQKNQAAQEIADYFLLKPVEFEKKHNFSKVK